MTQAKEIAAMAEGLVERQKKSILSARYDGADYRIALGSGRGLMNLGLAYRHIDGTFLTETGLAVRKHLEAQQ